MRTYEKYYIFFISMLGTILVSSGNETDEEFFNKMVSLHNEYRTTHGARPLVLEENATYCADATIFNWDGNEENRPFRKVYGYNIYRKDITLSGNMWPTAETVFLAWYNQGAGYDYTVGSSNVRDPFTQIVWQRTRRMGVARLVHDNHFVVVVTYEPAGNKVGQYINNVIDPATVSNS